MKISLLYKPVVQTATLILISQLGEFY